MKKSALIFAVFLLAFALAACGGGNAPVTSFELTMTDFHFTPEKVVVPAGKEITVTAINNGAVVHEFVIFKLGETAGDKFGDEDEENIYWEVEVQPGATQTVTFTAPSEAGEYYVTCGIEGHLEAGMTGTLVVVP